MLAQLYIAAIFVALLYCLVFTAIAPAKVFAAAMVFAWLGGLVETTEVLDKAGNVGLVTLLLLLLVSIGLEKLPWLSRVAQGLVVSGYRYSLLRLSLVTAAVSAFVNNTAVVATLANAVRENDRYLPSTLLLPLSYAAVLGGTMTLIGTSTNLIVSSFVEDAGEPGLPFFSFLPVGLLATGAGLLVMVLAARLLPRHPRDEVTVAEYLLEAEVSADSPLIGRSIAENGLRELDALFLAEIVRGEHLISPVTPQEYIEAGDKLLFSGDIEHLSTLQRFEGLRTFAAEEGLLRGNLVQVVLMPGATIEGRTIKESGFRSLFDAAVVALRRGGQRLSGKLGGITLQAGDSLMLAVGGDFFQRRNVDRNFLVVGSQALAPDLGTFKSLVVALGMLLAVALAALNVFPLVKGLAALLVVMLLLRVLRLGELRRRFPFEIGVIIASALILAQAMENTGLVAAVAEYLRGILEGHSAYVGPDRCLFRCGCPYGNHDQQRRRGAAVSGRAWPGRQFRHQPRALRHGGGLRCVGELSYALRLRDESDGTEPRRLSFRALPALRPAAVTGVLGGGSCRSAAVVSPATLTDRSPG